MMSPEALAALAWVIRYLLISTCGGFLVAHGMVKADDLPDFANNAVVFGGSALVLVATWIWGWWSRRKAAVIARVAAMPEIHAIHADQATADAQGPKVTAP